MLLSTNQVLYDLKASLLQEKSFERRLEQLVSFSEVKSFLMAHSELKKSILSLESKEQYVLFSLIATGQDAMIFQGGDVGFLAKQLLPIEEFYEDLGGVIGYHLSCLDLLLQKDVVQKKGVYHAPKAIDIAKSSKEVRQNVLAGISHLPEIAEIYPVGGAADRLSLRNKQTGVFQIAATLSFAKKSLLERLIEDLKAREFLYWKLFGKKVSVPVVLMSSAEKNGTEHLEELLEEKGWFGKKREDFFLFSQPLVPTMCPDGQWQITGPCQLLLKPGGHGVIWKLAKEKGALAWLKEKGRSKAFVRQINNVMAGIDYGLLAFLGIGAENEKEFGFAACPRLEGVSEGVNVVIETDEGFSLTNIEYCDFKHYQVEEKDLLANTNLLFVDLKAIEKLVEKCPIPGMLVNAKKMQIPNSFGALQEKELLRLESTMQNIADALVEEKMLSKTFITTNKRRKTISPIKKEFAFGSSMLQTPEQCYLDLLENARDLLENYCAFDVPSLRDPLSFFLDGPSFIFLYHPALGPQYEVIGQKLRGGRFTMGSEVNFEIAEIDVENLDVDGSLEVTSLAVLEGRCTLKNVRVQNSGIHREASRSFWKDEIIHKQKCEIVIEENGELYAEDVIIRGDMYIHVPSGVKVKLSMDDGALKIEHEVLESSWRWDYNVNEESKFLLTKKSE
ncbi:MAG: UTP--glucose-1-phosphate uridylyltransferase [Simkaniaceae bacterium]|nr:UTP--glucose-1-phosphate uridylyltransferase [Candidatus Sacchlamyda saccharinae]